MKKVLVTLGCVLAAAATYAQGTVNFTTRVVPDLVVQVTDPAGNPLDGAAYSAQLYGGPQGTAEAELQALGSPTTFRTGAGAGFVTPAGAVAVPGVPEGGTATLQLRAWDNANGTITSWETASIRGESNLFDAGPLGGVLQTPPNLVGLQPFQIPEPSTIVLSVLGVAALAFARRRK